jgi:hypothetical protein
MCDGTARVTETNWNSALVEVQVPMDTVTLEIHVQLIGDGALNADAISIEVL